MVCCVITAILLAVLHRLMPWQRASDDGGFAPVAVRSAMELGAAPSAGPQPERWLSQRDAMAAWTLRFAGLTAALYLVGTVVLVVSGSAEDVAPAWMWVLRSIVVATVAVVTLSKASRLHRRAPDPSSRTEVLGFVALASGATAMLLLEVDMHLIGLYHIRDEGLHTAVHATAAVAMLAGVVLTVARRGSAVPATTTVGGAR